MYLKSETASLSIDSLNLQPLVSSEDIGLVNPVIPPFIWEPNPPGGPIPPPLPPIPPPPPIATPEPGTGLFLILALSVGCLLAKFYGMRHEFRNL